MQSWITKSLLLSGVLFLSNASPIERNQFKPTAVNYVPPLDASTIGKTTLSDNVLLTITGGFVVFLSISPGDAYIYYDGYDSSSITMTFTDPVSAIGMDWISNSASPTLSVYNAQNVLLESLTLDWTLYPKKGLPLSPYGFIGIDVGDDLIAYATIDTALPGNELFVGAWIYQPPGFIPDFTSPKQSPNCEPCIEAYRTEECQAQESQHMGWLSVDIPNCVYEDVDKIKITYGCVQNLPGCDTWVCTEHIPDDVIQTLTSCDPVILQNLWTDVKP